MPDTGIIYEALNQVIQTQIFEMIVMFIVVATIMMLLKVVAEGLTGYIQFRLDKHIAIGSPIEIFGKKGIIKEISVFTITVETECGYIRVPTKT